MPKKMQGAQCFMTGQNITTHFCQKKTHKMTKAQCFKMLLKMQGAQCFMTGQNLTKTYFCHKKSSKNDKSTVLQNG